MRIEPVHNLTEARALLSSLELPYSDLTDKPGLSLVGIHSNGVLIATAGIEQHGDISLLRSVAVAQAYRGKGRASKLVEFAENAARSQGMKAIYLLTNTAEAFFSRLGYQVITREETPLDIKRTQQFESLCPVSAKVMRKLLA